MLEGQSARLSAAALETMAIVAYKQPISRMQIAAIRGVEVGKTVLSPASHSAFRSVDEMLDFAESIASETGLPVGIKSAVGDLGFWTELAELMARDALARNESCGGHFRAEYQDAEGEADRDDENFQHAAAWEWNGEDAVQTRHQEELEFNYVMPSKRSYK